MNLNRFYIKFCFFLFAFAFGLSGVWLLNGLRVGLLGTWVKLPQTASGEMILVYPKCRYEIPKSGGSGPEPKGGIKPVRVPLIKCIEDK